MQLGLFLSYWSGGGKTDIELVQAAEACGYTSVWAAEAWGSDAVSVLGWIAGQTSTIGIGSGIMQIPARTPAMTAMTAMTLDGLSSGRFRLGLGASGPQVVEGWHGQPYARPLARTREYVAVVRAALERSAPLEYQGDFYEIPYLGSKATGLGKPLQIMGRPRADLPIYLAAMGPKNVSLAAEIADGWLPVLVSPEQYGSVFRPHLTAGLARSGSPDKPFDIAPTVNVVVDDDLGRARDRLRPGLALYVGGMGAKGRNFYNDLVSLYGYEQAASKIQDLYLAGKQREAIAAVPDEMIDELCLAGPPARIRDRLAAYSDVGIDTLLVTTDSVETVRSLADQAESA